MQSAAVPQESGNLPPLRHDADGNGVPVVRHAGRQLHHPRNGSAGKSHGRQALATPWRQRTEGAERIVGRTLDPDQTKFEVQLLWLAAGSECAFGEGPRSTSADQRLRPPSSGAEQGSPITCPRPLRSQALHRATRCTRSRTRWPGSRRAHGEEAGAGFGCSSTSPPRPRQCPGQLSRRPWGPV